MKKVYQTKFGNDGNCFKACLASLLEIDINDVPSFTDSETEWRKDLNIWLAQYGYHYLECICPEDQAWIMEYFGYHIITGESPRGQRHAVIGLNGKIFHDPHPSNYGLHEGERLYGFLIPTFLKSDATPEWLLTL